MIRRTLLPILFLLPLCAIAQVVEIKTPTKMTNLSLHNSADSVVVVLSDGTLARRDAATLGGADMQILSISNDTIFLTNGGFIKLPVDLVDDADADPANELQSISKNGNTITLSNNGGSFTDAVDDADADAANELQTITKNGSTVTLSNSGGSFTDAVDDADADATNELQTIAKDGNTVTLSNNGGSFTDAVDDADNDASNELQSISFSNDTLRLSDGGFVLIPDSTDQMGNHMATQNIQMKGNFISQDGDNEGVFIDSLGRVGINKSNPSQALDVNGDIAFSQTLNTTLIPSETLDVSQLTSNFEGTGQFVLQSFKIGTDGLLSKINIFMSKGGAVSFRVYEGTGSIGALLYEKSNLTLVAGLNEIVIDSDILVEIGQMLSFEFLDIVGALFLLADENPYPDGSYNPTLGGGQNFDLKFQTFIKEKGGELLKVDSTSKDLSIYGGAMTITRDNRVGIGTTPPSALLEVSGESKISTPENNSLDILMNANEVKLHNIGNQHWSIKNVDTSGHFVIARTSDMYDLGTPGNDVFVISPSQNVGIGRAPETNRLEVQGSASKSSAGDWLANSDARLKTNITLINYYN